MSILSGRRGDARIQIAYAYGAFSMTWNLLQLRELPGEETVVDV